MNNPNSKADFAKSVPNHKSQVPGRLPAGSGEQADLSDFDLSNAAAIAGAGGAIEMEFQSQ